MATCLQSSLGCINRLAADGGGILQKNGPRPQEKLATVLLGVSVLMVGGGLVAVPRRSPHFPRRRIADRAETSVKSRNDLGAGNTSIVLSARTPRPAPNTAKLFNENPTLMRLRGWGGLEKRGTPGPLPS